MKMEEQQEQTTGQATPEEVRPVKKGHQGTRRVKEVLGGDYLSRSSVLSNIPFLLYVTLLAVIYIANTFYAEKTYKEIERTKTELKELRYRYITTKSILMFQGRQSEIGKRAERLALKVPTVPPYKILYSSDTLTANN
jgi:hypothetical protein